METGNFFEKITMKNFIKGAILGMALCGTANLFAADSMLSELATARGRFVGAILNSDQ